MWKQMVLMDSTGAALGSLLYIFVYLLPNFIMKFAFILFRILLNLVGWILCVHVFLIPIGCMQAGNVVKFLIPSWKLNFCWKFRKQNLKFIHAECNLTLVQQVIPRIIEGSLYAPAAKILQVEGVCRDWVRGNVFC